MRRAALLFAVAAMALAVTAAPAAADDAAVLSAYRHGQPAVKRAVKAYLRAIRAVQRTDFGRRALRRVIRADRLINRALTRVTRNVGGQKASTETGTQLQRCNAKHYRQWRRANLFEIRAARAGIHHRWKRLDRLYERADRAARRGLPYRRCERRALKELRSS
jgi:hypothetical protein